MAVLFQAVEYLGLQLTEEQKHHLRSHLHIDGDGMVQYGGKTSEICIGV